MLPQLVGQSCARCAGRIGSEIDGRFCEVCGNPVHNRCSKCPPGPASNDDILSAADEKTCPRCGADPHSPASINLRRAFIQQRVEEEVAPFRRAAASDRLWVRARRLALVLGAYLLIACTAALRDPTSPVDRRLASAGIGFGLFSFVAGLWFVWIRKEVAQRHEQEREPPE